MIIQFNTDHKIPGSERQSAYFSPIIAEALGRFSNQITRIEVHLTDENSHKEGQDDKRCMLEARLEGLNPIAVTSHGESIERAVKGAIEKMKTALDSVLGKLKNH